MNKTLFWGGVLLVGYWWMKNGSKNLGPATNDLGFGSNPTDDNISLSESANWWSKWMQGTPALAVSKPRMPTDSPEQIRQRILYGSGL